MSNKMKVLAPLATAVAVVALVGGAALLSSGGAGTPKRLHLAGGLSRDSALGAPATSSAAGKIAGGGDYTLVGTLPAGAPDDAAAWTLPAGLADGRAVAALATALGLPAPVKNKDGWSADGLQVSSTSGQSWYFSPCAVAYPVPPQDAPSTSVASCAIASGGVATDRGGTVSSGTGSAPAVGVAPAPPTNSVPVPPPPAPVADQPCTTSGTTTANQPVCAHLMPLPVSPPPYVKPPTPTSAEVFSVAGEVLSAVGLGEREGQVQAYPGGGTVTVNPQIDGLDMVGMATTVQVGARGGRMLVESANGWLAPAAKGDSYPLISAQKAFDALPSFPRMELCPVGPDGQGCTPPAPQEITGAHVGLMLAPLTGDALALLPAWLFDVKGTDQPVSGIAVEPSYLDTGTDPTADPGTKPGASTDPGTVTEPGTVEPAQPQEQIVLTGARQSKADNAVTVLYENGGCGRKNVAADVKEDDKQVFVFLHADAPAKDIVCTANSVMAPYEVALQGPLAGRTVIDGTTGKPVPLS